MLLFNVFCILVSKMDHGSRTYGRYIYLGSHHLGSYRRAHKQDRLQTRLGGLVCIVCVSSLVVRSIGMEGSTSAFMAYWSAHGTLSARP